jgi:predicted ABC-type transport system involved in lysophospholipase L1 biosynthesis ATPase subunit
MNTPLLLLEQLTREFPVPDDRPPLSVLSGIDLRIEAGTSLAIVGPSGSGKSTLLNLIGGLDRPTTGRVLLEGQDLATLDEAALAQLRSRELGLVFQSHHLLPQCSIWENVLLPTLACDEAPSWADREARARLLLEQVGLSDRVTHRPGQLSGGECQRAAVARALINGPKLLLADEPTGSLDAATSAQVADLLLGLDQITLIVVTHAPELAERLDRQLDLGAG